MKNRFSTIILTLLLIYISFDFLKNRIMANELHTTESTIVYLINIFCLGLLLITTLISGKIVELGEKTVTHDMEDQKIIVLERLSYKLTIYSQIAFTLSLLTLIAGFLLLRDEYPKIVLYTAILVPITFYRLLVNVSLIRFTRPDYQLPNPNSKDYQEQLFNCYDDGEKHVMLKSLYKLYYVLQTALVILMFVLMFYSIFSGVSQLFSIIAIGLILLFMQLFYLRGMRVKN
ncbi:DUF3169 family protein [Bacillus sp. JJ722]|uniref:DUF3169 family protein n=1 Tax=Bacillus sp. JJ722 TaxID=3122973 RepID=UPI003000894F